MGLQYNGVSWNSQTGTSTVDSNTWQPTTGTGENNPSTFNSNDQKWWQTAIQSLPGILAGTSMVIQSTKNNQPVYYGTTGVPQQQFNTGMSGIVWILLGVGLIALLYFAFRGKKTAKA